MNTIFDLWKRRIRYFLGLYYQFIAFQFDIIILAYTLVFVGLIGYSYFFFITEYIAFISKEPWFTLLQIATVWAMLKGTIKGYLKVADEIFLSPMNNTAKVFVGYSEGLSITVGLISWGIFVVLLYILNPILQLGRIQYFVVLYMIGVLIKLIYMNLKFILYQRYKSFWGKVMGKGVKSLYWGVSFAFVRGWFGESQVIMEYSLVGILSGVLLLATLIYVKKKMQINWSSWIADESNERARMFSILMQDFSKDKYSSKKSTFPAFSGRKLEPFNPMGALLLLYFRMILRDSGNLLLILQVVGGLIAPVFIIKEVLIVSTIHLIGAFLLSHFLVSFWEQLVKDVWVRSYPFTFKDKSWAFNLGPLMLVIPIILFLIGLRIHFTGTNLHPVMELVGMLGVATITIYLKSFSLMFKRRI
ncbi:ABC transporter permease [Alkaliphilus hydrothermalis]|uniref:ABC-2 type transport system permease protein n=1 Tax=Alkaliphilus hydrothermalis TaxID=1482730 RepID=A0ABS2NTJ8_9FIRM|nr:ABC transporter permease [Alkaliphilus hydrothermalis]MBM7615894.1 ABC-2 type transport system permease protein [Alkaliphilus hydrothermalis]